MSFVEKFSKYEEVAPPGVRLPEIDVEQKYYDELGALFRYV